MGNRNIHAMAIGFSYAIRDEKPRFKSSLLARDACADYRIPDFGR